ncbi:MAG: hypothetical protein A2945_03195 [Candidatus Liptonbacteria bacterium RIFCSPLOWO2_01_FULL_52_25]|uniref:Uncharacterized protein n=1 Tax=Candidatus Liptonbacteria bacterium RIFCSPLOWO2_01_FULL_52_25 TaxID=1798650 RepID=A0A1G2CE18_9BACT|nr:MAG: hypothetical protein A2945_03195 [Candidatus Liptonbacteria bacterium RIFCSPLOWO2_01_FULL_52_25]
MQLSLNQEGDETMEIRLEKHYGKDVFVSVQAEAARKAGCLCVRQENGRMVMCEHLKANIAYEAQVKAESSVITKNVEERAAHLAKITIQSRAVHALESLCSADNLVAGRDEYMFGNDSVCLMALANYAVCISGNLAMAVTRCPHYKPASAKQEGA